jgi:nitrate/TMAO reductase-like tetraheme cytochrome c subunit
MTATRTLGGLIVLLLLASAAPAQQRPPARSTLPAPPLLGDQTDGSRARPVHRIPVRDAEDEVIRSTDRPLLPFSPGRTCGADCHDVATIGKGWHFATARSGNAGARPGEPWILVDPDTATQLPLSYHPWPGTFRPDQIGITPWAFAKLFGGRTPGGLAGEGEQSPALQTRWAVSGPLEPNCLACHDASPAYDHAEYARQISLENFRWAAAGASGLALVTGAAREMPDSFDFMMPVVEDALQPRVPSVAYAQERFLPGAKVIFDIVREVPARRCYFCHSTVDAARTGQGRWTEDVDIHLARGMTCVDCHRNGLDHQMTRGDGSDPAAPSGAGASLSCAGCHLASEPDRVFARGRVGAPYPRHAGLPPIHLQKLSCTACHSGPRPEASVRALKTSRAHRLGGLNVNKAADVLPHLFYPVFARQADGVTTPNRLMWPAFWGRMAGGRVTPLAPEYVKQVMAKAKVELPRSTTGTWPAISETMLARILEALGADAIATGIPVYVAGGKMHRLAGPGRIATEEHQSAQPYLWPIAHDVRPAALALGARGCQDCHDAAAPIFSGRLSADTPIASRRTDSWPMSRFQKGLATAYVADLARSFQYRVWMKVSVVTAATILLLFTLAFVMPALGRLSAATRTRRWVRLAANLIGLLACSASLVSGYPALISGERLTGYWLMIHAGSAPVFAAGAVLVTLYWADRNRFGPFDWNRVRRPFGTSASRVANSYIVVLRKLSFWIAAMASIPVVVSATLALFPLLASIQQLDLFRIHRYAVWTLAISALVFASCGLAAWIGRRPEHADEGSRGASAR